MVPSSGKGTAISASCVCKVNLVALHMHYDPCTIEKNRGEIMQSRSVATVIVLWSIAATAIAQLPAGTPPMIAPVAGPLPPWAYTVVPAHLKPAPDDGKLHKLSGSNASYTWTQIRDLFTAKDWFPDEHPAMPEVVARGRKPELFACGMCHYPN